MVFSSTLFLFYFLPLVLAVYYATPGRARAYVLTLASYVFYGWWRPDFVLLMLASTVVDFTAGRSIAAARERGATGRAWVTLSCVVNLGLLGWFKYADFGIATLNRLLQATGAEPLLPILGVVLPVGISFYTFQTMSYTIDVYRGVARPVDRFVDFAAYVSLFPQLVAGPIVRYNTIADQLRDRAHTLGGFYRGVLFFQTGLAKKVLVADVVGGVADQAFTANALGAADAWIGVLAYAFQIYFDFSGYSDMAIGLGLMLGFRFPVNFDGPYRAVSITDFWRRWHISLSTWLRDYLYVPLGGNRKGAARTYVNLALVMLLGGLWHGAAWTFVVWGAYQGAWLVVERLVGKEPFYRALPRPVRQALTFVLVLVGWVFFRARYLGAALDYLGWMVGAGVDDLPAGTLESIFVSPLQWVALLVGAVVLWGFPTTQASIAKGRTAFAVVLQPLFVLAVLHLLYVDHVPFLYFRF